MPHVKNGPIDRHVAAQLRAARLSAGLTQTQAGEAIGVKFQQIQKYESANNRVTAAALFKLANFYGKPVGWFFPAHKR
jgi:transcriptional regulator with XRE-family HTH domain